VKFCLSITQPQEKTSFRNIFDINRLCLKGSVPINQRRNTVKELLSKIFDMLCTIVNLVKNTVQKLKDGHDHNIMETTNLTPTDKEIETI
jgi:hypothetical protein